jgi:primosomal protein N' (replication factor Y) (superfamily II helicase)
VNIVTEKLVEIVLPLALRHPLIYRLPATLASRAVPGRRVRVPLGSKTVTGVLLGEAPHPKKAAGLKVREVAEILDEDPLLLPVQLKLLRWASAYYLTPIGEVLRHLAPPEAFETRRRTGGPRKSVPKSGAFASPHLPPLNAEQEKAYAAVVSGLETPSPPILLHGVTGSGKTEIYLRAARKVLEGGGQVLVLVPEIGLTPQLIGRFQALGEGEAVAAYHSALTPAQRREVWKNAREGRHRIIIATRSGIFLPMSLLKLIVVDEEHDPSYKQEERFCYHARDLALWRAAEGKILVVLGSATPSLESLQRVEQGKMTRLRLSDRPSGARLPDVKTVDRRGETEGDAIFSPELLRTLEETLARREQALLFVNRRGFAPFVLCPACGHVPTCDQCDVSLTLHKGHATSLLCHYCDRSRPYVPVCPACGRGTFALRGFGTERVASEAHRLFPGARIARMDRDTVGGGRWLEILEKMKRREIDVLVGTQMITKGHDYPHLTLAGILDADVGLHLPDFRAAERTYQILTQVAGRAGRSERPGRVLIQTYRPSHESLIAAANQSDLAFSETELQHRREAGYPPFLRLVEIRFSATRPESARKAADALSQRIARTLSHEEALLGPAPCPIETVRGKARWHLLVKTPQYARLQPRLAAVLDDFAKDDLPSAVKMLVNVDPVDMM